MFVYNIDFKLNYHLFIFILFIYFWIVAKLSQIFLEPEELSSRDILRYTETPLRLPNIRIPKRKPVEESPKDEPAESEQISPTISPSTNGNNARITTPKRRKFLQNSSPILNKVLRQHGVQFNRKEAEEERARDFLLHEFLSEIFNWNPKWLQVKY